MARNLHGLGNMRRFTVLHLIASAVLLLLATPASAFDTTITLAGSIEGAEVDDWRTPASPKNYDADGDGIYGSLGALSWLDAYPGMQAAGSTTLGWAPIIFGAQRQEPLNRSIDNAETAPANHPAGIALEGLTFQLTGVDADYAGKIVRVGVMTDLLGPTEHSSDRGMGLHLYQTAGGTGNGGQLQLREGATGDGFPEMVFWDIAGVHAGDQFRLQTLENFGQISFYPGYLGAVSWDLIVPEPATAALSVSGAVFLLARRRRVAGERCRL